MPECRTDLFGNRDQDLLFFVNEARCSFPHLISKCSEAVAQTKSNTTTTQSSAHKNVTIRRKGTPRERKLMVCRHGIKHDRGEARYGVVPPRIRWATKVTTKITKKMKNRIFAIPAAAKATPPNPKSRRSTRSPKHQCVVKHCSSHSALTRGGQPLPQSPSCATNQCQQIGQRPYRG